MVVDYLFCMDRELRSTLISALIAFSIIITVVVRDAANEDGESVSESATELSEFVAEGEPRHDRDDEVVLESAERLANGDLEVIGWAADTDHIEVLGDGAVIGRVAITQERPSIAIRNSLRNAFVGFRGSVAVANTVEHVCVVRPEQLPGLNACGRPQLDLNTQRVVAFYGVPGDPALGTLGDGTATSVLERLVEQSQPFATADRTLMLAFEVIATVAQSSPGSDGNYSAAIAKDDIWEFLEKIREVDGALVIDFQTGRDQYLDQVPEYVDLLSEPDVHIALDPEWDMEEGEIPNQIIGSSDSLEINEVMEFVAQIVRDNRLPRKTIVLHNFTEGMIANRELLDAPPEIDVVVHMDGHGPPETKIGNYGRLSADPPFFNGFKVFYGRDFPRMTPGAVLSLDPEFVSYQ